MWAGRGGAGEALRREGGDKEVRNSWLCILHEGEESTASQMTAIHCDQKDDTVSLSGFRESQTDFGSQAPQCSTVGLCFQIEKSSVGKLALLLPSTVPASCFFLSASLSFKT